MREERADTCLKLVILRLKDLPLTVMVSSNFFLVKAELKLSQSTHSFILILEKIDWVL